MRAIACFAIALFTVVLGAPAAFGQEEPATPPQEQSQPPQQEPSRSEGPRPSGARAVSHSQPVQGEQPQPPAQQQPQAAVAPTAAGTENLNKAVELNTAKKYPEAESEARTALSAQPANPNAHLQLAIALFEQGKFDPAGQELEQAKPLELTGTPVEQADFYQYRGSYLARKEKWAESAQDLEKAIQLDPKEPYNHYYIGVAYSNLKKPDKMVEHLQMFLRLAPTAPEAAKCKALLRAVQ